MSRGPSGSNVIWEFNGESGLDTGVWKRLQNHETNLAGDSLIASWPNGSATRTTLPAASGYDGIGKAVRFELRDNDLSANGERSELSGDGASWQFAEGDERWLQYRIKFASNWTPGTAGRFNIVTQFHSGSGSPPLVIEVTDAGELILQSNGSLPQLRKVILSSAEWTAKKGQWIDLNLHWKNSIDPAIGFAQVYIDGVEKVTKHSRQTMSSSRNYLKIGMYRHSQPETNVIWFDDMRLTSGAETGGSGGSGTGVVDVQGTATYAEAASATSLAINVPTGAATGEKLVLAIVNSISNSPPPLPAGWTAITTMSANQHSGRLCYRNVSSEPASYTVTSGSATADRMSASMVRIAGANSTTPFDLSVSDANNTVTSGATTVQSITFPDITTVTDKALVLYYHLMNSANTSVSVPPSQVTKFVEQPIGDGRYHAGFKEIRTTAGATGVRTFAQTSTTARFMGGMRVVFRPTSSGNSAPSVSSGADATIQVGQAFSRTAGESDGGSAITSRKWEIVSGPTGVGTTLATTAAVSWSPTTTGTYTLRYSATNAVGTGTDDVIVSVQPSGTVKDIIVVQSAKSATSYGATATHTSHTTSLTTPATAGNLLVAVWSVDLDAGTFTPPTGWTVLARRSAGAVSILVVGKIAAGGEQSVTASWTTASNQVSAVIAELDGVHPTNPYGPSQFPVYEAVDKTSIILDPAAATAPGAALAFIAAANARAAGAFEPSSTGWVLAQASRSADNNESSTGVALLHDTTIAAAEDIAPTFSWSASTKRLGFIVLLNSEGSDVTAPEQPPQVGTTPTLSARWVGFPETGLGRVTVNTNAVKARLKVGTDPDVTTDIVYGPYATPNAQGDAKLTVGLPQTYTVGKYYYRVAMVNAEGGEWLDTASQVGILKTAPTGRVGLTLDFGSCCKANDSAAVGAIANRDDDLMAITGDFYYADGSGADVANFRSKFDSKIRVTNFAKMMATRPTIYVPDDHDGMTNDGTWANNTAGFTSWNQVFREKVAHPDLPQATRGVYWTRPWGTAIRIICLDTRSYGTGGTTVLGATQKQWFKDTITAMTEDVAVIVQGATWIIGSKAGEDGWEGTVAERNEIGDFLAASGKKVVMLAGDMHAVGGDNGTNSRGGVPIYHAAPLNNTASQKGGPYSAGVYPASGTATVEQYGRLVITLADTTLTCAFTGYSADNTIRKTITNTFPATPPPAGRVRQMWDGAVSTTRAREVWNGTTLSPTQIEK